MSNLFESIENDHRLQAQPLAARIRPRSLQEFVGQSHFLGEGRLLRRLIRADRLGSLIFYGPPGTGKTTLAQLLAQETKSKYCTLNAISSGVKELRSALELADNELAAQGRRTLLFIDEIHRFNRSQQDALLEHVENGVVSLVGATTANPFFALNSALTSRSTIFQFEPLNADEIEQLLLRALSDRQRGLGHYDVQLRPDALQALVDACDGDARRALGALEVGVLSSQSQPIVFDLALARESIQRKAIEYDATGDSHYDCASAFIKSIRGSDADAGLYWLARMLEGGEDVRFIARRLVILASEDIGNADPQALQIAVAGMQACEFVGLPECQLTLSQLVTYLACAPKSNAATVAIEAARRDVREGTVQPVPRHLKDRHYSGAVQLGHGDGYHYSHEAPDGIGVQDYLSVPKQYYQPTDRGFEQELQVRLQAIRRARSGE
ncbi:MAG: replication-associated recombination protein A [Planctomycetota bacterium]|nr:replication-associated recombination protein A [Planctomycetota bacterium]MDA1178744.1 replication-associated recombination protein A [Planctomycetota bacterium]